MGLRINSVEYDHGIIHAPSITGYLQVYIIRAGGIVGMSCILRKRSVIRYAYWISKIQLRLNTQLETLLGTDYLKSNTAAH